MTLPETLTKFERVIYGCNEEQLLMAEKWCDRYIKKYYSYPNNNYEILLEFVKWCIKTRKEKNLIKTK